MKLKKLFQDFWIFILVSPETIEIPYIMTRLKDFIPEINPKIKFFFFFFFGKFLCLGLGLVLLFSFYANYYFSIVDLLLWLLGLLFIVILLDIFVFSRISCI
jgi:hypothetical protein